MFRAWPNVMQVKLLGNSPVLAYGSVFIACGCVREFCVCVALSAMTLSNAVIIVCLFTATAALTNAGSLASSVNFDCSSSYKSLT